MDKIYLLLFSFVSVLGKMTLPANLIKLGNNDNLLDNSVKTSVDVLKYFENQRNRTYCGAASLAIAINSLWNTMKANEDSVISSDEAKSTTANITKSGLTLEQLQKLCEINSLTVSSYTVSSESASDGENHSYIVITEDQCREIFLKALQNSKGEVIISNFFIPTIGFGSLYYGHFSPIVTYNAREDRVLVADVWPDFPNYWVKFSDLFSAMNTIDSGSGKHRGFLIVSLPVD